MRLGLCTLLGFAVGCAYGVVERPWLSYAKASNHSGFYRPHETVQIGPLSCLYEQAFGRRLYRSAEEALADKILVVEVGGYDGLFFDNAMPLVGRGWPVVFFEPAKLSFRLLSIVHGGMPNVMLRQVAIGSQSGSMELSLGEAFSTLMPRFKEVMSQSVGANAFAGRSDVETVAVRRLDDELESMGVEFVSVLIVDVEGFEEEVFSGFSLSRWRPAMLIVELEDFHPHMAHMPAWDSFRASYSRVRAHILSHGYVEAWKDAINTVFVTSELYSARFESSDPGDCVSNWWQ
jgi:FkbM family methyltransferase